MKLSILLLTLISMLISLAYVTSSRPLQTATSTAFDSDGHEVQPGLKYYITPIQSNDSGGGLSLVPRDGFCPPFVVQENSQLSKGLPLRFLPLDTKQNSVTLSSDVNIVFMAATICVQSTVWKISTGVGGSGGGDDMVVGQRYYVGSGGVVGRPGAVTVSNWFKIEKVGEIRYKFVFCPNVCGGCKVVCGDVGVLEDNGKKWLAIDYQPFVFTFKKAY